ncbi:MAG: type III-B CRISPR module-associated protein Cmr5 [Anaerolineae bacterium]|nr:type III-B CRISPR module-associated protein Cmr5 [Anaerolineae bacterium]
MSRQQSLEQKRAAAAWERVVYVRDHGQGYAKKYGQLAKSAPADIQANGLGQTLAFWRAKTKEEHSQALFKDVSDWVKQQLGLPAQKTLLEWIMQDARTDEYRRATAEAIAFLNWLKRFAEAELGGE